MNTLDQTRDAQNVCEEQKEVPSLKLLLNYHKHLISELN